MSNQTTNQTECDASMDMFTKHYESGQLKLEAEVRDGKLNGTFRAFYEDGRPAFVRRFADGKIHGLFKSFYPSQKVWVTQEYQYGRAAEHTYRLYYESGVLALEHRYNKENRKTEQCFYDPSGKPLNDLPEEQSRPFKQAIYQLLFEHGQMAKDFWIDEF